MSHMTRLCSHDSSHRPEGSAQDNTQPVALNASEFVRILIMSSLCLFLRMGDLTRIYCISVFNAVVCCVKL